MRVSLTRAHGGSKARILAKKRFAIAEPITICIPTPLRSYADGADQVMVQATTVPEALAALGDKHPGILERVLAADGRLRQFANLYLGADNIRVLNGLATPLKSGPVVAVIRSALRRSRPHRIIGMPTGSPRPSHPDPNSR